MAYCQHCGHKLDGNYNFCPLCGVPALNKPLEERQQTYAGKLVKCPNCGELLNAFETKCKSCGYELRGATVVSAVKQLEIELNLLEDDRPVSKCNSIKQAFIKAVNRDKDNTDEKKASLISNFVVPNTEEDIFEFMIMAVSNIDPVVYDSAGGYSETICHAKLLLSNAWEAKYLQAYQKAKLLFPHDTRLRDLEQLYSRKRKEILKYKLNVFIWFFGFLIFAAGAFLLLKLMGA